MVVGFALSEVKMLPDLKVLSFYLCISFYLANNVSDRVETLAVRCMGGKCLEEMCT